MPEPIRIPRRDFLVLATGIASTILTGWSVSGCLPAGGDIPEPQRFDALLALGADGTVLVRIPVPEIGQGVRTSLAMLVAEELGVEWASVRVEQAEAATDLGPHPFAGGSWSIRAYWLPMRQLGAAVREAVCAAAAERLGVASAECVLDGDRVRVQGTARRIALGEVLAAAAKRVPADRSTVALTAPGEFRLLGRSQRSPDVADIVRGTRVYGIDVTVPGMCYAVLRRPPVYGATVRSVDASAALQLPGVRAVETIPPIGTAGRPYAGGGVAVIADTTWAAMRGRDALIIAWDEGPNATVSTAALEQEARRLLGRAGDRYAEGGQWATSGAPTLEADYLLPFLPHLPMEPPCCTVHRRAEECELWAPTQMPMAARALIAQRLDLSEDTVRLHVPAIGGGFGRRLKQDFVLEAVEVARHTPDPVQVLWTREDDIRNGFFRPMSAHRMRATVSADGTLATWFHRQVGTSRYAFREGVSPANSEFLSATYPGTLASAHRLEYRLLDAPTDRGPLRAPGHNALAFPVESFLDELAAATGQDPLQFRRRLLDGRLPSAYDDEETFDPARLLTVLERASAMAASAGPAPGGAGRGLAGWFTFGSYCAHVVEATVDDASGTIRVPRVWSAIDCGFAVHPDGVRAQVEGGIMDGLGAALYGGIIIEAGRVVQANFDTYQLLRMAGAPSIEVAIIASAHPPTGAGEPPYPPVAPALANAVFAATGTRLRQLPLTPSRVLAAMGATSG